MATKKTVKRSPLPMVEDMSWRAKDDMHTLGRAREIEMDSKRFSAAKKEAQNELKKIQSVINKKK